MGDTLLVAPRERVAAAPAPRAARSPHHLLALQRLAGNRATAALVQRKACCTGCATGGSCERDDERDDLPVQRLAGDRPTVRQGSTGPAVGTLQAVLNNVAAAGIAEDAIFGPDTRAAVEAFQQGAGLDVDGIVGPATWQALEDPASSPQPPSAPGKSTDPADDFRIKGLPADAADHPGSVFFDFASAEIAESEAAKLDALAAEGADLLLEGSSSEEGQGNTALTEQRISAVAKALADRGHTAGVKRKNSTTKATGQIDYRAARVVRVARADAPDPLAACDAGGKSVVTCPDTVGTAMDDASRLLLSAILRLGNPADLDPGRRKLVKDLFIDDSDTAIAEVVANLVNLREHLDQARAKRQEPGQSEPSSGPFHRCENDCNATCSSGALAFNRGSGGDSFMSFCDGFTEMTGPAPGTGTSVEQSQVHIAIHEAAHGAPAIACKDFAKGTDRAFGLLDRQQALHNADSYTALARNLVDPGSAATRPLVPDTGGRAGDPGVTEPIAWLDRWLEAADFDTAQLYGVLADGAALEGHFHTTMLLVSQHFPVTRPPGVPTKRDREKVAAINDRYDRVRKVLKGARVGLQLETGPLAWAPGPGTSLTVPADFGNLPMRDRIEQLAGALFAAFPDVRGPQEISYTALAPKLCNHRSPGFAFSAP